MVFTICDRAFVREKLMFILEDAQVPLEWVNKWKQSYIIFMIHFVYKISYLSWGFEKYLLLCNLPQ